ncbi:MAG: polyribonucleotide nucleotidyltransferase [Clostridiales bacterium]|nr:polyribonucleotide nucleotidyltransferase [Clostridiales bacterium]
MFKSYSMELGGRTLTLEFGKYAEQAAGSTFVRYGETAVLVNAAVSETIRPGIDFFPLGVDYEEKLYSVGHIPGSWNRREGRPGEKAILTSRLIDRPLRPLFPKGMRNDVAVTATVMSVDFDCSPETPAMIGASAALCVSQIPFAGPVGAVNIGLVDDEFVINPTQAQREVSALDLTVAGTKEAVLMVEAGANEVSEEVMLKAILFAHEQVKRIVEFQETIVSEIGKTKQEFPLQLPGDDVKADVREYAYDKVKWMFETFDRSERQAREEQVKAEVNEHFAEKYAERMAEVGDALYAIQKEIMRRRIIDEGIRPDARKLTEVRPIWCETGVLPRPHGSAVFTRGQTQVMTICTLAPMSEVQILDGITPETTKRYMHHYNFPGYSTGEAKPLRTPGRREIGHGALAERALRPMIPSVEEFPYCLRLVSEVMSSNGSTSQASVCGSTLALMDAGVPIKRPVAGVAMGLIKDVENTGKVAVLTDIQGLEDFLGDMDFKVAGTAKGITAIQMDIKIKGIDEAILRQALAQAYDGRMHILGKMLETLPAPRPELSKYAPKIIQFTINPEKIGEVVGPKGKMINSIIAETGVKIDIEDDGNVYIATENAEMAQRAKSMIEGIVRELKVGDVFTGKVARIMSFGAFVEYAPGKDGMIHISKLANKRVEKVEDVVNIGDTLECRVAEIDSQGRINLVRNDIVYDNDAMPVRRPAPRRDSRNGGRRD